MAMAMEMGTGLDWGRAEKHNETKKRSKNRAKEKVTTS